MQQLLKEIGRGKDGARALSRAQAAALLGHILDGRANDLQVGAFCVAMRIKGETAAEMAGFLDAVQARLPSLASSVAPAMPAVVLPSYNGARRLPVLTPLLALLLVRQGLPVLLHGCTTERTRVTAPEVLQLLGHAPAHALRAPAPGELVHLHTRDMLAPLARLLDVRAAIGLRNPAHALVKLLDPLAHTGVRSLVVGSYTHPEYAISMAASHAETRSHALLLRGLEGESVADPRRQPALRGIVQGEVVLELPAHVGSVAALPDVPTGLDAAATAALTLEFLDGRRAIPAPLAAQVRAITELHQRIQSQPQTLAD